MTRLQKLTAKLQRLCPELDGWEVKARYVTLPNWRHGNVPAVVEYEEGGHSADIQVRRDWRCCGHSDAGSLSELVGHEIGHLVLGHHRLRPVAEHDIAWDIAAILARASNGRR